MSDEEALTLTPITISEILKFRTKLIRNLSTDLATKLQTMYATTDMEERGKLSYDVMHLIEKISDVLGKNIDDVTNLENLIYSAYQNFNKKEENEENIVYIY